MLNQNQKATPAYKGARFDTHGNCLTHIDVRLCRLTSNGQYKIVRKTCYKCGSAALMNEAANNNQGGGIHGYKKKSVVHRTIPSELYSGHHHRHHDREKSKRCDPKPSPSSPVIPKKDRLHYGDNPARTRRRGRTLSPPRGSKGAPKPPLSKSHIIPKISKTNDALIKELLHIKPPFSKKVSKGSASHSSTTRSSLKEKPNYPSAIKNDAVNLDQGVSRAQTTAQGIGHCQIHREVALSIRRTTMTNGQWRINKDVCPICFPSDDTNSNESSLISSLSSGDSTKNLKQIDMTSPNTPRSVLSLNNNKYYTSSPVPIVEYNSNIMGVGNEKCTSASPAVPQKKTDKKNHWKVFPNSTARIARRAEKKGREQQQQPQVQAYDAWETLPLY